jgi:perosamine synthetase
MYGAGLMEQKHVPLARPSIGPTEIEAITEVLRSGWLAHGEYNHKFEEAFARLIGVPYAITMNSCASALEAALKIAGIQREVVIPSFTMVATANAVVNVGATPVFCDVDEATRNMTATLIEACITPRTEAVIVVHYGGQPCQMDDIVRLCERYHLLLIEDSAETLGATWQNKQAGSFGIGCFSFFPTKNITTGEGGMLTCHDAEFAYRVRALISHGIANTTLAREKAQKPWLRAAEMAGHNYRMPNPLAALGYYQLQRLHELNTKRVNLAERYNQLLASLSPIIRTPSVAEGGTHVYQMYTVQVNPDLRDRVLYYLRDHGVGASVHFDPPVHLQPYYRERGGQPGMLPVTERLASELITLPIYPGMTEDEQDWVVHCLSESLQVVKAA